MREAVLPLSRAARVAAHAHALETVLCIEGEVLGAPLSHVSVAERKFKPVIDVQEPAPGPGPCGPAGEARPVCR